MSEINFKSISVDNEIFRYDAEYFRKEPMQLLSNIRKRNFFLIEDKFDVSKLAGFEFTEYFTESNLKSENNYIALTSKNIQNEKLNLNEYITIDKNTADMYLQRSKLLKNDIVLSYTGEYRRSLVMLKNDFQLGPNVCRLRPKENYELSFFVSTFFNSKIGQIILDREKTLSAQPTVAMSRIRKIPIPYISKLSEIKNLILNSNSKYEQSQTLYRQAEELLLETIGLKDFQPSQENKNIKSFSESFLATGRLDAEYYQPKYDTIEKAFNKFDRIALSQIVTYPISSGMTPTAGGTDYTDSTDGIPFIRAVDLVNGEVRTDNFNYIKQEIHNGILKRTQLKKNDVLFSIAGTVGRCAIFDHNFPANINQAISILRFEETKLLRPYIVVFFNSFIGKEYVSKYARQGLQTNLNLEEVGALRIPVIEKEIQRQIDELIEKSFYLCGESMRLLEEAKDMVEKEIEK